MKAMKLIMGGAALMGALSVTNRADALETEKQGTFKVAAERLVGLGLTFGGGNVEFGFTLLPTAVQLPLQFPRVGADYFVIDGLSIGGNLGITYYTGGGGTFGYLVQPRVGYEFALSNKIDFWPRLGLGVVGTDPGSAQFLITLEGQFLYEIIPAVSLEFGPTLDLAFDSEVVALAGNAGLVVAFD